nr:proteasome assembly chaperone 2 [Quercus suber]
MRLGFSTSKPQKPMKNEAFCVMKNEEPRRRKKPHDRCSTLLLPALSIGNVGQLAMDLMVSSTRAERIGFFDDPFLLPCVGNDAYGPQPQGQLALPLEAYDSSPNALTLVQQRSPVVKDRHFLVTQLATPVFGQTATQPTGKTPQETRPVNQSVIIGSQVASASSGPSTGANHIPLPEDPKAKAQAPEQDEDSSEEEEGTKSLETTELS